MPDFTLPDGRGVSFDLMKVSMKEYRAFVKGSLLDSEDDLFLARVTGLAVEDIEALPQPVYRRMLTAFAKKAREPLEDIDDPKA